MHIKTFHLWLIIVSAIIFIVGYVWFLKSSGVEPEQSIFEKAVVVPFENSELISKPGGE